LKQIPPRYYNRLDEKKIFSHTAYNFPALMAVCEKLAREALAECGGRVERDSQGDDVFVIPVRPVRASKFEDLMNPGPVANSRFTPEEVAQIKAGPKVEIEQFAPGWKIDRCGRDMDPGLKDHWGGKTNVFVTHPLDSKTGCALSKTVAIPTGKTTTLRLVVGHHPKGDWMLVVRADGRELLRKPVGKDTAERGWMNVEVDLSPLAGKSAKLELANEPTGWSNEAGYWAKIAVESR
jgi:hypothetical protein